MYELIPHFIVQQEQNKEKDSPLDDHHGRSVHVLCYRPEFIPFARVPCDGLPDPPSPDQREDHGEEAYHAPHPPYFDVGVNSIPKIGQPNKAPGL